MKHLKPRLTTAVVLGLAMLVLSAGAAIAGGKKNHHSGHEKIAAKLKADGNHQLDRHGKHTVSADVKGGKIAAFHVKHDTKGDIAVKKYKSNKKIAELEGLPTGAIAADQVAVGTEWIAYAYIDDDGNEEYYWFPYEEILDGDTGAITYVPET